MKSKLTYKDMLARSDFLIQRSAKFPYCHVSKILSWLYIALTLFYARILDWRTSIHPSSLDKRFARVYDYVPEMALYKSICYDPFLAQPLKGKGLDLGCGNGLPGSQLMQEMCLHELHGVDLKPHHSPIRYGYTGFSTGDLACLEMPPNSFDYAISIGSIEHVPFLDGVFSSVKKILKPDGLLAFTYPNTKWIHATAASRLLQKLKLKKMATHVRENRQIWSTHERYLDSNELRQILTEQGFKNIQITPIFHRDSLFAYDMLNIQSYLMAFFVPDRLTKILEKWPRLKKRMRKATEKICAYHRNKNVDEKNTTLNFVSCQKA